MLHKNQRPLKGLEDWRQRAGPKSPSQWQDFRSAKEAAKHWLASFPSMPADLIATLGTHPHFSEVEEWSAEPEVQLRFDKRRGEPRNTDLLVRGRDATGPFAVAVEAKADEVFGQSVTGVFADAVERLAGNPGSGGVARIADLIASLLPAAPAGAAPVRNLRYQLLTAAAGVLSYAESAGIERAVLYIQEFITPSTTDERHAENQADLERWLFHITAGESASITNQQLLGPIKVPGKPLFSGSSALYIGKGQVRLR